MTERDIFLAVLDLADPVAQAEYLDRACGGDTALRARVEGLLRSHVAAGSFLRIPAVACPESGRSATRDFATAPEAEADLTGRRTPDHDEALGFLAPPGRPDSLGRIGHYEVLEVLGRGGFGVVFRAFDEVLQRVVAVKVLAPQLAAASPARKRFLREARSSAAVRHENVLQVYAVGERPLPYLVMEFIPGETLQQRLDRTGPLEVLEVVRIGRQIAEGLAAAHATGLIHRDIKPANVLLDGGPQPRVKITDFGLARAADDASLTRSGVVAGTPMYMSPEQARGAPLDHRTDLFSLGSVLYAICSGRPPFRANGTMAVLKRVCEEDPRPIREVIPEVPEWLCRIVEKLLAKDPDERFQTAREVADLLADCESRPQAGLNYVSRNPVKQPLRPRRRRFAAIAGASAILLLLCWAVWSSPAAMRYISNRGEVVVLPAPGLITFIVWRDGDAVTDWFDAKTSPTIELPPGKYEFKTGFWPPGRTIERWEVTTQGLFSGRTSWQGKKDLVVDVARGDRVIVRAVMRDEPNS
jgi:serine/threonine protein kinase